MSDNKGVLQTIFRLIDYDAGDQRFRTASLPDCEHGRESTLAGAVPKDIRHSVARTLGTSGPETVNSRLAAFENSVLTTQRALQQAGLPVVREMQSRGICTT